MLRISLLMIFLILVMTMTTSKVVAVNKNDPFITSLCEYAKIDSRFQIRKRLKAARLKLRRIYPTIRCEGKKFHAYAVDNNALDVIKFIETKVKPDKR